MARTPELEALHGDYLRLEQEKSELEGNLLRFELELLLCGQHQGITDICTYRRDVRMTFDGNFRPITPRSERVLAPGNPSHASQSSRVAPIQEKQ